MLASAANPRKYYEALNRLEFNVVVDLFMNPTAVALADIVLPRPPWPSATESAPGGPLERHAEGDPVPECKPDEEICFELARRFNPT